MSPVSVALHLLLSLCLILNGIGAAAASAHAPMFHEASPATAAPAMAADVGPSCHDQLHTGAAMVQEPALHPAGHAPTEPASPDSTDCCQSGTCVCACMHLAHAMSPPPPPAAAAIVQARSSRPLSPGHAAPALPHLTRPPIG